MPKPSSGFQLKFGGYTAEEMLNALANRLRILMSGETPEGLLAQLQAQMGNRGATFLGRHIQPGTNPTLAAVLSQFPLDVPEESSVAAAAMLRGNLRKFLGGKQGMGNLVSEDVFPGSLAADLRGLQEATLAERREIEKALKIEIQRRLEGTGR
jgi:hypothetical protein